MKPSAHLDPSAPGFFHPALREIEIFARHELGDMTLVYTLDRATGQMQWSLIPTALAGQVVVRRTNLNNDIQVLGQTPEGRAAPWMLTPLVNVRLREQDSAGP
ncbi:MAG: hypothetical protein H7Y06_13480, partial [Opitutaceae bacterium]|nr:hypothetical protein [Opitutaceae bacterium]